MANEKVREVCAEMKSQNECYACREFADRILAAYQREIAAKDEMTRITTQSAQARFDEEMAAKDAEIARLRKDRDYYREMYDALMKGGVVR